MCGAIKASEMNKDQELPSWKTVPPDEIYRRRRQQRGRLTEQRKTQETGPVGDSEIEFPRKDPLMSVLRTSGYSSLEREHPGSAPSITKIRFR